MKDDDDDWIDDRASGADLPSVPPEERERVIRGLYARLSAETAQRDALLPGAPLVRPEGVPPPTQAGATLRSPPAVLAAAGEEERGAAPVAANDVTEPRESGVRMPPVRVAPAFLTRTEQAPDLTLEAWVKLGALPFKPPPEPPPKRAAKTVKSHILGLEPGQTDGLGEEVARAMAAVLPFPVPSPPLTLRQYASLRAELALWPERSGEILDRYHVRGDAARGALDAHWGRVCAARPEAQAAFEQDFASYTVCLHARRA